MRRARFTTLGVILGIGLSARIAGAATFEIPLSGLLGRYGSGGASMRTAAFTLPGAHPVINGISLRAHGVTEVGQLNCQQFGGLQPWPTDVEAWMDANPGRWTVEQFSGTTAGAFGWTQAFFTNSVPAATWAFLDGGSGVVTMTGFASGGVPECLPLTSPPPAVTLDEVTLLVDADFPVPTLPRSWGGVKAIYR